MLFSRRVRAIVVLCMTVKEHVLRVVENLALIFWSLADVYPNLEVWITLEDTRKGVRLLRSALKIYHVVSLKTAKLNFERHVNSFPFQHTTAHINMHHRGVGTKP